MAAAIHSTEPKVGDAREMWILTSEGVRQVPAKKHTGRLWWAGIILLEEDFDIFPSRELALRAFLRHMLEKETMVRAKIGELRAELCEAAPQAGCPLCLGPLDGDHDTLNCAIVTRSRAGHLREAMVEAGRCLDGLTDLDTKVRDARLLLAEALGRDDTGW